MFDKTLRESNMYDESTRVVNQRREGGDCYE